MQLHQLKPRPGAKHRRKRVGSGESSGKGKTSGRGHKGQKSRAGSSVRPGFEGGQMPLIRRLPKRGFNNKNFKTVYGTVNLGDLNRFDEGTVINEKLLRESGLVRGRIDGIKILGRGEIDKKLQVEATKISEAAKAKLEKAGGTVVLLGAEDAKAPAKAGK